jgi:hypothetical protein
MYAGWFLDRIVFLNASISRGILEKFLKRTFLSVDLIEQTLPNRGRKLASKHRSQVRSHYFFNATDASRLQRLLYRQFSDFFPGKFGALRPQHQYELAGATQKRPTPPNSTAKVMPERVSSKATSVPDQTSPTGRYAIVFRYISCAFCRRDGLARGIVAV